MSVEKGMLVAIIIVLTILLFTTVCRKTDTYEEEVVIMEVAPKRHGAGCRCPACVKVITPEHKATSENAEYFTSGQTAAACADDNFTYAVDEFGAPGLEFKDWAMNQAVDAQMVKNHTEFVKDRVGGDAAQNTMGRTYSPDTEIDGDQTHWIGLRRPQAVAVNNPDQVPDVKASWYSTKPTFTWASS